MFCFCPTSLLACLVNIVICTYVQFILFQSWALEVFLNYFNNNKPKMVNAPEGLNQVILRKVQRFLTIKVAKTASTHYKLPFINANNFH